jgi:hypothetical protein
MAACSSHAKSSSQCLYIVYCLFTSCLSADSILCNSGICAIVTALHYKGLTNTSLSFFFLFFLRK